MLLFSATLRLPSVLNPGRVLRDTALPNDLQEQEGPPELDRAEIRGLVKSERLLASVLDLKRRSLRLQVPH